MKKQEQKQVSSPKADLMPAIVFAALTLIGLIYGNSTGLIALTAIGSVTLYSALCLFQTRSSLGIAIVVIGGCWAMQLPLPLCAKITFFSIGFLANRRMKEAMAPVSMLVMLWLVYFACNNILEQNFPALLFNLGHSDYLGILIEVAGVTLISFVPFLRLVPGFSGSMFSAMTMTAFAIHASTLLLILIITAVALGLRFLFEIPFATIEEKLLEDQTRLALLAFSLYAIASSFGLVLSSHFSRFVKHVELLASPAGKPFRHSSSVHTIQELHQASESLQSALSAGAQTARAKQSSINQLKKDMRVQEQLIIEREAATDNLTLLMNAAPWGSLACSGSGKIIIANETFCELLDLDAKELKGKHFHEIEKNTKWKKEVTELLNWVCRELHHYNPQQRIIHNLSTIDQTYLQCEVRFTKSAAQLENNKSNEKFVYDDLAINLFIRETKDTRALQLGFLSPSPLEIMGTETNNLSQNIQLQLSSFAKKIRELEGSLEKLQKEVDSPIRQTESGLALATGLKDLDSQVRSIANELRKLSSDSDEKEDERKAFNLTKLLPLYYYYLSTLLSLEEPLPVIVSETNGEAKDILVNLLDEEALSLFSYLLFLVKHIIPRGADLKIRLGAEDLTEQTANFIPGAIPGSYARISLSHSGQSITPQMRRLDSPLQGADSPIQIALSLLNIQLIKLGGFISIQSSPTKGTNVTAYLPINPAPAEERAAKRRTTSIHSRDELFESQESAITEIVLIADSLEESETLQRMFSNVGHKVSTHTISQVTENSSDNSMLFGGSGFGDEGGSEGLGSSLLESQNEPEVAQELSNANAAIILESQFEESTHRLLSTLRALHPHLPLLLISDARNSQKFERLTTAILTHPFTAEELESAIHEAVTSSQR